MSPRAPQNNVSVLSTLIRRAVQCHFSSRPDDFFKLGFCAPHPRHPETKCACLEKNVTSPSRKPLLAINLNASAPNPHRLKLPVHNRR